LAIDGTAVLFGPHQAVMAKNSRILLAYSVASRNGKNAQNRRVASVESLGSLGTKSR
jgi:hypothetical protein